MPLTREQRTETYRRKRQELLTFLGGVCVECGATESLEFDHLKPREWVTRDVNRLQRIKLYREEAERGDIVLRCGTCNKVKGSPCSDEPIPY